MKNPKPYYILAAFALIIAAVGFWLYRKKKAPLPAEENISGVLTENADPAPFAMPDPPPGVATYPTKQAPIQAPITSFDPTVTTAAPVAVQSSPATAALQGLQPAGSTFISQRQSNALSSSDSPAPNF